MLTSDIYLQSSHFSHLCCRSPEHQPALLSLLCPSGLPAASLPPPQPFEAGSPWGSGEPAIREVPACTSLARTLPGPRVSCPSTLVFSRRFVQTESRGVQPCGCLFVLSGVWRLIVPVLGGCAFIWSPFLSFVASGPPEGWTPSCWAVPQLVDVRSVSAFWLLRIVWLEHLRVYLCGPVVIFCGGFLGTELLCCVISLCLTF